MEEFNNGGSVVNMSSLGGLSGVMSMVGSGMILLIYITNFIKISIKNLLNFWLNLLLNLLLNYFYSYENCI